MRTRFRWLALLILPLFILRATDVLFNVDPHTGFFTAKTGWLFYGVGLGVLVLMAILAALKIRKVSENTFAPPAPNFFGALFLASAGVIVLVGSVSMLLKIIQQPLDGITGSPMFELRYLFMRRTDLLAIVRNTHFRIEFWCALAGILVVSWAFVSIAWRLGRGKSGAPVLLCLPAVWFGLRAICDYAIAPVNPNNTIILSCLITDLLLALFYLRFARVISLGRQPSHIKWLAPHALLAAGFTLTFNLPLLLLSSGAMFSELNVLFICSDAAAALAALILTDHCLKEKASADL